jgi:hemoglobin/transferrin/lactoferrin receptor protein
MQMSFRVLLLGSAAALALTMPAMADDAATISAAASAAGETQTASNDKVEKVTVTATRQKRRTDEVPATVTVITDKEIEDNMATDVKDLVRFEPGVSVRTNPVRFSAALSGVGRDGNSGFNIRGLEGNRVLIQIDGIRVPDAFSFGPQVVGRGDYLDLDIIKSVEILRGPASALYGSDGVAGAVSFVTKDPDDFLDEGEFFGGRARVAYSSADDSWSEGVVAATQTESGKWQGMLAYTRRDAQETENQGENEAEGSARTAPNPSDIESNNVFAKLVYAPSETDRVRLTYEYYDRFMTTNALSARGPASPPFVPNAVLNVQGEDETTRDRVALDGRHEGDGFISNAFWAVYYQSATTREFTFEDRSPGADRTREGLFDNSVFGGVVELQSSFDIGGLENNLVYGADYSVTEQEGLRLGTVPTPPDVFPNRPFPKTDFTFFGAFIQDEISLFDGKLKLYPAVRFDSFEVDPEPSTQYLGAIAAQEDSHVTPKFGAVFWPVNQFGLFANYAQGFKAPAPSQVNNGFANVVQDYESIPNPNLKPETSETFEGGARIRDIDVFGGTLAASATAFRAEYEDFIDQVCVDTTVAACAIDGNPATGTTTFQYVNLSGAEISGFEARADIRWDSGFALTAAFSTAEGTQILNGVESPLNTIDPWKVVAGVRYDDADGNFGGQLIVTHAAEKDQSDITLGTCTNSLGAPVPCFTPDAFTIVDMTAYWNITEQATLRVGVFNVLDEKYAWWSDARGLPSTSPITDAYTQPGRNASASLIFRF